MKMSITENNSLKMEFDLNGPGIPLAFNFENVFESVKNVPENYSGCLIQAFREWMNNDDVILYYVDDKDMNYRMHFVWETADGKFWHLLPPKARLKFVESLAYTEFTIEEYIPNDIQKLMILLDRKK